MLNNKFFLDFWFDLDLIWTMSVIWFNFWGEPWQKKYLPKYIIATFHSRIT